MGCSLHDLNDYFDHIILDHRDSIAFKSLNNEWSYKVFIQEVFNSTGHFKNDRHRIFSLEIGDPYLFAVIFFSVMLSGNIVSLFSPPAVSDPADVLDDKAAASILNEIAQPNITHSDWNDPCLIIGSSGTTGEKKNIVLSIGNLLSDMTSVLQYSSFSKEDVYLKVLPYSHLFGLMGDLILPLYSGGTICYPENTLSWMRAMRYFRPSHMHLPPAAVDSLELMTGHCNDFDLATGGKLQKIICGGASVDESKYPHLRNYGVRIHTAYGLSECSPCVSLNGETYYKKNSVGKILPCCQVKIVDGEIAVRGSNVMLGYYKDEQSTKRVLRDGWLFTGDLGFLDDDGFLYLTGRKTNLIVLDSGIKIVPEEIEKALEQIPAVLEALVQKQETEEKLQIFVVLAESADDAEAELQIDKRITELLSNSIPFEVRITDKGLKKTVLGKKIRK